MKTNFNPKNWKDIFFGVDVFKQLSITFKALALYILGLCLCWKFQNISFIYQIFSISCSHIFLSWFKTKTEGNNILSIFFAAAKSNVRKRKIRLRKDKSFYLDPYKMSIYDGVSKGDLILEIEILFSITEFSNAPEEIFH